MAVAKSPDLKTLVGRLSKNAASLRNVKTSTEQIRNGRSMSLAQAREYVEERHARQDADNIPVKEVAHS
jgi:hypothetical protein